MTSSTFETVAGIISETADIPREQITPESHAIDDLGIDSLAFLDIAFAIDKAFGIKLPLEQWTQEVNEGKVPAEQYFVLKNLVARIDELVAEHFDLRPAAILRDLQLQRPIFSKTAAYGHFGRDDHDFTWERTDKADALRAAAGVAEPATVQAS